MNSEQELLLVKKAQNGDRQALGELWDAITPKLFGYLINVMRDKTLAEDLLQATWLKAIQALPKFKAEGVGISAWLFAIARNECRQHWRNNQKEVAFNAGLHDKAAEDNGQIDQNILIEQMLSRLSQDDQELLRLRYISDLPINDVAKILNINFVAARVRLHRALARARSALNP